MKRILAISLLSTILALSACNDSTTTPDNNGETSQQETNNQETTNNEDSQSSESGFSVSPYEYDGTTYYHYEASPEEVISKINEKMLEGGYSEFKLGGQYISDFDNAEDSYYYYTEGKTGKLTINTYHGIGKVVQTYVVMNDAETEEGLKLNQYIAETMIDTFAPSQGKNIASELEIYSLRSSDEYEYREVSYGNSNYRLSVPEEFTINPTDY